MWLVKKKSTETEFQILFNFINLSIKFLLCILTAMLDDSALHRQSLSFTRNTKWSTQSDLSLLSKKMLFSDVYPKIDENL